MTMQASVEPRTSESPPLYPPADENPNVRDEERAFGGAANGTSSHSVQSSNGQSSTAAEEAGASTESSSNFLRKRTSQLLDAIRAQPRAEDAPLPERLAVLVDAYRQSAIAASVRTEIEQLAAEQPAAPQGSEELPDIALENSLTRGRKRASWATQFRILSGRAFKNLYRDPALLTAHYISSVVVAREYHLSIRFFGVTDLGV